MSRIIIPLIFLVIFIACKEKNESLIVDQMTSLEFIKDNNLYQLYKIEDVVHEKGDRNYDVQVLDQVQRIASYDFEPLYSMDIDSLIQIKEDYLNICESMLYGPEEEFSMNRDAINHSITRFQSKKDTLSFYSFLLRKAMLDNYIFKKANEMVGGRSIVCGFGEPIFMIHEDTLTKGQWNEMLINIPATTNLEFFEDNMSSLNSDSDFEYELRYLHNYYWIAKVKSNNAGPNEILFSIKARHNYYDSTRIIDLSRSTRVVFE